MMTTATNKLPSSGTVGQRYQLAGALQDMWHYAALIIPPTDHSESTFVGSREYKGLIGKLNAYEALVAKIEAWQIDELPALCALHMPDLYDIDDVARLLDYVALIQTAVNEVARANDIDAYSGECNKSTAD